jgi:hypothetical protein
MANDVRTWRFNYGVDTGTGLLDYEYSGLAVNFADTTYFNTSTWAMDDVIERNSNTYDLQSPHVFFTQGGTSPKYVRNSSTTIGWSPHNLSIQSQDMATSWGNATSTETANTDVAPDGTTTADTVTASSDGAFRGMTGSEFNAVSGFVYTISGYFKATGTTPWVLLGLTDNTNDAADSYFDLVNGLTGSDRIVGSNASVVSKSIEASDNGFYRCIVTVSVTESTDWGVEFYLADADNDATVTSGDTLIAWGLQINRGYSATAYIATTTAAKIGLPISYGEGLLVEPAATNLYQRSQEADNAYWTKTNSSIAANSTAAPDGSTTADTLTSTSTSNARYGVNVTGLTNDGTHTHSVYAKAGTASWLVLVSQYAGDGSSTATWFNLGSGTVGTVQSQITSASITSVGDGWYRCSHTYTNGTATATTHEIYVADGDNSGNVTNGVNIYVWGAQLEAGAVATSYVPTVSATATRAADAVNVATSAYPHSDSTGTAICWIKKPIVNATNIDRLWELSGGATAERVVCLLVTGDSPDSLGVDVTDGNVTQVNSTVTKAGSVSAAGNKVAAAWQLNSTGIVADGGSEVTDTGCTMPTITRLDLGYSSNVASRELNGLIQRYIEVPRRMTEADMQGKTA